MKTAVWCRHDGDNVIGIGSVIPWHIKSDFKRFNRITLNHSLIVGQTTYETFPNRTLPRRKIYVLSFDKNYQVSDCKNHHLITDPDCFNTFPETEELFISGGAGIYKLFLLNQKLAPDYIVDCCYLGEMNTNLPGPCIDITPCVKLMQTQYNTYEKSLIKDNVRVTLYLNKNKTHNLKTILDLWQRLSGNI